MDKILLTKYVTWLGSIFITPIGTGILCIKGWAGKPAKALRTAERTAGFLTAVGIMWSRAAGVASTTETWILWPQPRQPRQQQRQFLWLAVAFRTLSTQAYERGLNMFRDVLCFAFVQSCLFVTSSGLSLTSHCQENIHALQTSCAANSWQHLEYSVPCPWISVWTSATKIQLAIPFSMSAARSAGY